MSVAGTVEPRFDGVSRIAVLRGGGIGDLLLALPAIESLHAAYPDAELVLLGSPVHADLLRDRPSAVSRVVVLPVARGIRETDGRAADAAELQAFRDEVGRDGPIDLAVQLHGGGRYANPFLRSLGPRHSVGAATEDAEPLERTLPYVYYQHETMRWLEIAAMAGAPAITTEPRLEVLGGERDAVAHLLPHDGSPLAIVHAGASDPRRRWPPERFARVIEGLVEDGAVVRIVGGDDDRRLAEDILRLLDPRRPWVDTATTLAGELDLGRTAAILAAADVVVANDSGPRHMAQAVGAPTVAVYWFGNVVNAAPLVRRRHRIHISFATRCPVCGVDVTQVGWTAARCEHDDSLVAAVAVEPVLADARQLMATSSRRRDTPAARALRSRRAG